jgi:hypothetical protein
MRRVEKIILLVAPVIPLRLSKSPKTLITAVPPAQRERRNHIHTLLDDM